MSDTVWRAKFGSSVAPGFIRGVVVMTRNYSATCKHSTRFAVSVRVDIFQGDASGFAKFKCCYAAHFDDGQAWEQFSDDPIPAREARGFQRPENPD